MTFTLLLGLSSLAFCLALTPVFIKLLWRWRIIDVPDDDRKQHNYAVPRGGGLPILLSLLLAFGLYLISSWSYRTEIKPEILLFARLLPGIVIIFATGMIDDCVGLSPRWKLLGQITAALLGWLMGFRFILPEGYALATVLSLLLTVIWVVGCANMINLIDGVDGLAAGVGLIASIATIIAGAVHDNIELMFLATLLAGCLAGFLVYNSNPARIFLGDSGSLLVGFILGCCGIVWSQKSSTVWGMTAPIMLFIIPIIDVTLTIIRRFVRGRPLFLADRGHVHHRLLANGLTPRQVVLILYALSASAAGFALLQHRFERTAGGMVVLGFCISLAIVLYFGLQKLEYIEIPLTLKMLRRGEFSRAMLSNAICLYELEQTIAKEPSPHACWSAIRTSCDYLGFDSVALNATGTTYRAVFRSDGEDRYSVSICLGDNTTLELGLGPRGDVPARFLLPLARILRGTVRLDEFQELTSKGQEV